MAPPSITIIQRGHIVTRLTERESKHNASSISRHQAELLAVWQLGKMVAAQKLYPRATLKKIVKAHSKKNLSKNVDPLVGFCRYMPEIRSTANAVVDLP